MNIKKADNSPFELQTRSYENKIGIGYKHTPSSSGKMWSTDRGAQSDRYTCKLFFSGEKQDIKDIYTVFNDLKKEGKPVVLSDFQENIFAENIDHSGEINCTTLASGKIKSDKFRLYSYSVELLADTETLSFTGSPVIPEGLKCLQDGFESYSEWDITVNETYFRSSYTADSEKITPFFDGEYILNNTETRDFQAWLKAVRGAPFTANESEWGVSNMFGFDTANTSHLCVVESSDFEYINAGYKRAKIKLVKVPA